MPVSTGVSCEPPAKCCKYCDESALSVDGSGIFVLELDQDLLKTIKGLLPAWNFGDTSNQQIISGNKETINKQRNSKSKNLAKHSFKRNKSRQRVFGKNKRMAESEHSKALENMSDSLTDDQRQSPPKAIVDSSPLQPQMDKNKESLKVKLMVRRSVNQLVEQGIMPPLKPSPALHEQRKQLERAKTGDSLKQKIQQRPPRQELERRHILEHHEGLIDPSLAEKRRMLEKALLADQLNLKISHRPGPLELIEKNILHTEEPIERIVKEGLVTFKAANEGLQKGPPHPSSYMCYEEDSQSSEDHSQQSPVQLEQPETGSLVLTIPTSGGAVVVTSTSIQTKLPPTLVPTSIVAEIPPPPPLPIKPQVEQQTTQNLYAQLCQNTISNSPSLASINAVASPCSIGSSTSSLSPLSSVASPQSILAHPTPSPFPQQQNQRQTDAPGKDKNRKKSKTRPAAKVKAIKFHEYKGPPSAQKNNNNSGNSSNSGETNYQLILKQQSLLEHLKSVCRHPHILPADNQKPPQLQHCVAPPPLAVTQQTIEQVAVASSSVSSIPPSPGSSYTELGLTSDLERLGKMKVPDLRQHLKKLNLPVSGQKAQLIERLRPYLPSLSLDGTDAGTEESETYDYDTNDSPRPSLSPESATDMETMEIKQEIKEEMQAPPTPQPMQVTIFDEDIVRDQQRKIEELQRQLKESQQQLEQMKAKTLDTSEPVAVRLQHHIEAKMQKERLAQLEQQQQKQQREMLAFQQVKRNQQNNLFAMTQPKSQTINAFITPTKKDQTAPNGLLTFYENNSIQLTNTNGIPTLFVVGLDKKIGHQTHHRTASLPIVLPLNSGPPPLIEASQPLTIQQQQQLQNPPPPLKHQIPLPCSSPPELRPIDPIPPPQYEEATAKHEQLLNCKKQLQQKILLNSSNKKKTSLVTNNIAANDAVKTVTKSVPMSQDMTDVLEILIKRGELPENAVEPQPATLSGQIQTTLMINPNLMFENTRVQPIQQQSVQIQQHPIEPLPLQQQQQQQQQQQIEQVQTASYSSDIPSSLLLDPASNVLNMTNVMSPMQQDNVHEETLDKLLGQAQQNDIHTPHNSPIHSQQRHTESQSMVSHHLPTDFSELVFMDMDMDVDQHHNFTQLFANNSTSTNNNNNNNGNDKGRRDMNPSLTPSLNELIQLQQQHQPPHHSSHYHTSSNNTNSITNGFSHFSNGVVNGVGGDELNNNHENTNHSSNGLGFTDTPMDFENLLNHFEIPSNLSDTPSDQPTHCGNGDTSNGFSQSSIDHHLNAHDNFFELFNDDFRMSNDSMSCEVDNLASVINI